MVMLYWLQEQASLLQMIFSAITNGDPNILLVPKDSQGARCGLDSHVKGKQYLFFFDLTKCFGPNVLFTGCNTPQVMSENHVTSSYNTIIVWLVTQVCVEKCPTELFAAREGSPINREDLICTYDTDTSSLTPAQLLELTKSGKCASWYLPSTSSEYTSFCQQKYDATCMN